MRVFALLCSFALALAFISSSVSVQVINGCIKRTAYACAR